MNITRASVSFGSSRPIFQTIIFAVERGIRKKRKKKQRSVCFTETTLLPRFERHFALLRGLYLFVFGRIRWIVANVAPKRFTSDSGEFLFWSYIGLLGRGCTCNKKRWCYFRKSIVPQPVDFRKGLLNFYKCNDPVITNANSKFNNYRLNIEWFKRKFSRDPFTSIK